MRIVKLIKHFFSSIPMTVRKLIIFFLTLMLSLILFYLENVVFGIPAIDSGIIPCSILVFVIGLLYVPYEADE